MTLGKMVLASAVCPDRLLNADQDHAVRSRDTEILMKGEACMVTLTDNVVKHFKELLKNNEGGIRIFAAGGG